MECAGDPRSVVGSVRWTFAPLTHSRMRVLCHLLAFHRIRLDKAEQIDGDINGVLVIRPHRHLAAWSNLDLLRDDTHRVGHWTSDVLKHQPAPRVRPPH